MNLEEAVSTEVIEKVRTALVKALDEIGFKDSHTKDRLLVDFTREVCLSKFLNG